MRSDWFTRLVLVLILVGVWLNLLRPYPQPDSNDIMTIRLASTVASIETGIYRLVKAAERH